MSPEIPALPKMPAAPPPPPAFGMTTQKKPQQKSMQPTFLGSAALPMQGQMGTKTLLGQ